ncbi:PEP-CTERM sorting domain-containing protein [Roseateles violae]|uniref:PEP-CTERM sorting domain-containing protein n=1 Tax=Roseateles violae TaxID=3058042 RepID=A0ABT8DSZ4_9BURK|nr:PEP-CTERM sorting domain-containing protein [Pelomonas sp. PFR6]MDN3920130.1 PEP-CTERM sorting domain-containing protein [Pelomonas sp. PFR6]
MRNTQTPRTLMAVQALMAGLGLLGAMSAAHATDTWTFGSSPPQTCEGPGDATCKVGANEAHTAASRSAGLASTDLFSAVNPSNLVTYHPGGLGGVSDSTNAPNHALENQNNVEMVLLRFDSTATLTQVKLGWAQYGSDIPLLAYTGANGTNPDTAAALTTTGKSLATTQTTAGLRAANGWALVGNYADVSTASAATANAGNVSSSWWLVSAYNSTLAGTVANNCDTSAPASGNLAGPSNGCGSPTSDTATTAAPITYSNSGYDYVKVYSVTAATPRNGAPEPGSLALAGLALFGLLYTRRQSSGKS